MTQNKSITESTTVSDKVIGFDYQYYYFLYRLIRIRKGESVGLEVKDDVHTDLNNNFQILIQLKHTIQKDALGKPKRLTKYDKDLWKTLSNWSQIISDKHDGRSILSDQIDFVNKTTFMLVSNKSQIKDKKLLSLFLDFKNCGKILKELKSGTQDKDIINYISNILSLNKDVLKLFINKVKFELETDEIIQKCKVAIEEHHISEKKVDLLFKNLDSQIREDNFITVKNNKKITISYKDFRRKYRAYFDFARSPDLEIHQYHKKLPSKLSDQIFIKQLIYIGEVSPADIEEIAEFTKYMLTVKTNLNRWSLEGELTHQDIISFSKEAKLRWKNAFRAIYRTIDANDKLQALKLLDEIRRQILEIGKQRLDTEFSNGQYYLLSDVPEIGWCHDWENKYK